MKYNTEKEAGSAVLKKYGDFFKQQYLDYCCLTENEIWENNKSYLPLQITMEPLELVPVIDLVSSDNTLMTKILGALTSLCVEINQLKQEAFSEHFVFLSIYEEYNSSSISSQMKSICMLSAFTNRCDDVLRNICSQVIALYTEGIVKLNGIQLHYIINHIGELFTIIVLLDLFIQNCSLITNWNKYLKELKLMSQVPNTEEISEERLNTIQIGIENITLKIMSENIVQNTLLGLSVLRQKLVDKNASPLITEMERYMKTAITNLDKLINEKPTSLDMYKCIKINALFLLNSNLLGTNDKKIFKSLMELNSKAHSVPIMGTTIWYPEQFLQRFLPSVWGNQTKLAQNMLKSRQAFLANKKNTLSKDVTNLQLVCSQLILNIEEYFSAKNTQLCASEMNIHAKTLLGTIEIVSQTKYSLLTFINLHLTLGMPLSKTILMAIFNIIEMLKSIQNSVNRNRSSIVNSINMVKQHLMFQATLSVSEIKKTIMTDKNYANQRLDELTCIVIAEKALMGVANTERILAANVALSFVPETTYTEDNYSRLSMLLEKVLMLKTFPEHIEQFCDCSWLLWHQNVIPMYLDQNFAMKIDAVKLKLFLSVFEDCAKLFHSTDAKYGMEKSKEFLLRMRSLLEETVLKNMSHQIETNLRLHIHSHLQLDVPNPFTVEMTKKTLLSIDKLRLVQLQLSIAPHVEHYLSTMYYNLTTVVLADWKTYGEMRQMAKFKFNLKTVEDNLPTQTLEQGLDVLEIMRNINIFVSKYLYNLNNQIFIEKSSNNKHLNSINIKHVANSIRTHGTGIMNTTVNFTYQFLKKKFFTFSQFLYDEHIKSRLIKDLKLFKETAAVNGNMFNFKSAHKFNKAIRSLGLSEDGQTYLDLFRDLISQIGNAMGYVRMVRSGGRHCCADATVFLPTYEITDKFKETCEVNSLTPSTIESAEILDHNIDNLICNFMQGTEYFKLLVDVFAPTFRNPKNIHLNYFFIIIPPLTLNFVEHMILAKDKMTKKNKAGAAFTDDGFAMGVAYILKLLDQDKNFESLHWFDSVWKHIREERQLLEEQKCKGPLQLQQALALTEKKLSIFEQEFQLLYYSLTSARIFFR